LNSPGLIVNEKQNVATETAALVLPTVGTNYERHPKLQRFMLANDSCTVAVEIPIWLAEDDISAIERRYGISLMEKSADAKPRCITGHIDFIQVRNGVVHILDYKPDARTNRPLAQLAIYALALDTPCHAMSTFRPYHYRSIATIGSKSGAC
jgi:ATP-dependent exoDNAse (exonuclease V) beta subunit